MFCESGGNGVVEGLNPIWRVSDNDVESRDGGQVCEELSPSRSGQPGTSFSALSVFRNLRLRGMLPGTLLNPDWKASSSIRDVCFGLFKRYT